MRLKHSALILVTGFMLMPTFTWSQFPGGGGGPPGMGGGNPGGGGGRPGGGGRDPDAFFNMLSGGKEVIRVADLQGPMKAMFDRMGPAMGFTGPEITRDQFKAGSEKMRQTLQGGGMNPRGPGAAIPGAVPGTGGGAAAFIDERFKQMDRNGNGVLEFDEMSETLQAERDKWDTNKDGFIDLAEFKVYVAARFPQGMGQGGQPGGAFPGGAFPGTGPRQPFPDQPSEPTPPEEEPRPTIYRAGKLPKDLPIWFNQLDSDKDGQIGLYEWKNGGLKVAEFLEMDLNKDGFVTVDEYYRWKKINDAAIAKAGGGGSIATNFGGPGAPATGGGAPGMRGGFPGGGGGFPGMGGGRPSGGGRPGAAPVGDGQQPPGGAGGGRGRRGQ